jgi:lysine-specific histone demethylase 1
MDFTKLFKPLQVVFFSLKTIYYALGMLFHRLTILKVSSNMREITDKHEILTIPTRQEHSKGDYSVRVHTNQGVFLAKTVIVTIPLGVLKHEASDMFHPPLPDINMNAIERLGFGLIDKVILEFPWAFWPEDLDGFWAFLPEVKRGMDFDEGKDAPGLTGFVNMERIHKLGYQSQVQQQSEGEPYSPPVLVAHVSQRQAQRLEGMEDSEVGEMFLSLLRQCFAEVEVPELASVRITRWEMDPFSRGAITVSLTYRIFS